MRLATYNVEWFAHLFDAEDGLVMDDGPDQSRVFQRQTAADRRGGNVEAVVVRQQMRKNLV